MNVPDFLVWHCAGCGADAVGKKKPCNCVTNVGVRYGPNGAREETWWDEETPRPNNRLRRVKDRIDARLDSYLCDMREGFDDSIVGFNEAWDIVRAIFAEELGE